VELTESFFPESASPIYIELMTAAVAFIAARLNNLDAPKLLGVWLREAGIVDVTSRMVTLVPTEEEITQAMNQGTITVYQGMGPFLVQGAYMSEQRYNDLMAALPEELEAHPVHVQIAIAYGQKPRITIDA